MRIDKPYFMNDDKWYYFDEETCSYKLTAEATPKAKKSYEDFYELVASIA